MKAVVAVDVGSTSARAAVVDPDGRLLATASAAFATHRPVTDHAEHSSDEIWQAVMSAVRTARDKAGVDAASVAGLAFDATCSLVLLDRDDRPATVSTTGDDKWNVVMWADHRATAEAEEITATRHRALDYVGGVMSPEMELPKLLWLKRHLPAAWPRYGRALDLADFLTWRATGTSVASACTVTCKWTYLNHAEGWQPDLLERIGLGDLLPRLKIPSRAAQLGECAGHLAKAAAGELGLSPGTPVGVGLIDAHAGGLGVLGATPAPQLNRALALIAGTSSCHMAVAPEARPVPGIWGPYFGAMLPRWWLNEGGQSATGALLDHILAWHAEGRALGGDGHERVTRHILERRAELGPAYAAELLVVPDFHGNRSPLADPQLRGIVHGLDMDSSFESLARLYHATAAGIAYGTRHIVDELNRHGYDITRLHLTGGHARSELLVQLYADATGCDIVLPREADGVLLGTALAAATAGGLYPDLLGAGRQMVHASRVVAPSPTAKPVHERGYRAFRLMHDQRRELQTVLRGGAVG